MASLTIRVKGHRAAIRVEGRKWTVSKGLDHTDSTEPKDQQNRFEDTIGIQYWALVSEPGKKQGGMEKMTV